MFLLLDFCLFWEKGIHSAERCYRNIAVNFRPQRTDVFPCFGILAPFPFVPAFAVWDVEPLEIQFCISHNRLLSFSLLMESGRAFPKGTRPLR